MQICTINLTEDMIKMLKTIVDLGHAPSRSEAVRQVLNFGLPYFLGINEIYYQIGQGKFSPTKFQKPEAFPDHTIEELRSEYPYTSDYKYINEEVIE